MNKQKIKELIEPLFTKTSLIETIELHVQRDGMRYSEAIIHLCVLHELEPEDVAKLIIKTPLKEKIQIEAESLRLLPKSNNSSTILI